MATPNRQAAVPAAKASAAKTPAAKAQVQAAIAHYLPLDKTLKDALKLAHRFQEAEGFRNYLRSRLPLIVPAGALFVLISIACAAGTVILLAERHPLLALPGMVLSPFVLVGSFFVQAYVFFSWLESRAIAQALGRRKKTALDFGQMPRVPWALAAVFLVLPLVILAAVSKLTALVLIVLAILVSVLFAKFDR
jgi:hypothetical protein